MQRGGPRGIAAAMAVACTCATVWSAAAPSRPPAIELSVDGCPDIAVGELRRLLAVELAGRPDRPAMPDAVGDPEPDRVAVACAIPQARATADIALFDGASGQTTRRSIDLADVPLLHRARVVAIAIVELMAETSEANGHAAESGPVNASKPAKGGVTLAPSPPRSNAGPGAADARLQVTRPSRRRWRISVATSSLRTMGLDTFLWGATGGARVDLSERFAAEVDVLSAGNSIAVSLGDAGILLVSAGAAALARMGTGRLEWDGGAGVRGGAVRLAGTPASNAPGPKASVEGGSVVEPWGGPFLTSRLVARVGPQVACVLGVEGGYSVGAVVGKVDGVTEVAIRRLWLGISLGLGWSP